MVAVRGERGAGGLLFSDALLHAFFFLTCCPHYFATQRKRAMLELWQGEVLFIIIRTNKFLHVSYEGNGALNFHYASFINAHSCHGHGQFLDTCLQLCVYFMGRGDHYPNPNPNAPPLWNSVDH